MFEAQYERVELLGEGAFGTAYLVQSRSDPAVVQVAKEIRLRHLTEQQRTAAFAEAEVLRMMSHSNIVAYVAFFLEGPTLHILMEYANGGDLATKIKERREAEQSFNEREVMFIFVQLALALSHVHARKILHRDLKPLNVFLTQQGVVKLGDFGISRVLESASVGAQTVIGTPHYLSPEICNNKPYGVKSDLWSLGVLLYELAALQVPFLAASLPAVVMRICNMTPQPLPECYTKDMINIVFSLLDKEPIKRPALDMMLRSIFVQQHVQELLSHSLQSNSGGCQSLVASPDMQKPYAEPVSVGVIPNTGDAAPTHEEIEEATQLPRPADTHHDAVRSEFLNNRNAAMQAKKRAECGAFRLGGGSGRSNDLPDGEGSKCRAIEVRKQAQADREQRDELRKQELESAMREARRDRMMLQEARLARESNPVTGNCPPRLSAGNPQDDSTLESIPQVSETECVDLQSLRQELALEAKARQCLMERNADACFSPPFRPDELDPKENIVPVGSPWLMEIPFYDKPEAKLLLESDSHLVLEITMKPDSKLLALEPDGKLLTFKLNSKELTFRPDCKEPDNNELAFTPESKERIFESGGKELSLEAHSKELTFKLDSKEFTCKPDCKVVHSSTQLDSLTFDATKDANGNGLLCGTSHLVPITTPPGFGETDVVNLQAVLASALGLSDTSCLATSGSLLLEETAAYNKDYNFGESHVSLEYSMGSTNLSTTLRSLQEELEPRRQEATIQLDATLPFQEASMSPPLASIPLPSIAEDRSGCTVKAGVGVMPSSVCINTETLESEPLSLIIDTSLNVLNPEIVSPAPHPPSTILSSEYVPPCRPRVGTPGGRLPSPCSPKRVSPETCALAQSMRNPGPAGHAKRFVQIPQLAGQFKSTVKAPEPAESPPTANELTTDLEVEVARRKCACKPCCTLM